MTMKDGSLFTLHADGSYVWKSETFKHKGGNVSSTSPRFLRLSVWIITWRCSVLKNRAIVCQYLRGDDTCHDHSDNDRSLAAYAFAWMRFPGDSFCLWSWWVYWSAFTDVPDSTSENVQ